MTFKKVGFWQVFPLRLRMSECRVSVYDVARLCQTSMRTVVNWRRRDAVPRRYRARIADFFRIGRGLRAGFYRHWSRCDYSGPPMVLALVGPCLLRLPLRPGRVFTLRRCDARRLARAGAQPGPLRGQWLGDAVVWMLARVAGWWRLG